MQGAGAPRSWLKTGALKAFLDGAMGLRTAAMLEPYSDDPSTSDPPNDPETTAMAIQRDKAGFHLAFHAIGDRANRIALDVFAAVAKCQRPARPPTAIDTRKWSRPGFAACGTPRHRFMQPSHQTTDMRWPEDRIGRERIMSAYAWATMLKKQMPLAFGTDYPVDLQPVRGCTPASRANAPMRSEDGWEPQRKSRSIASAPNISSAYRSLRKEEGRTETGRSTPISSSFRRPTKVPPPSTQDQRPRTVVGAARCTGPAKPGIGFVVPAPFRTPPVPKSDPP